LKQLKAKQRKNNIIIIIIIIIIIKTKIKIKKGLKERNEKYPMINLSIKSIIILFIISLNNLKMYKIIQL
jgi:hypothetical protein